MRLTQQHAEESLSDGSKSKTPNPRDQIRASYSNPMVVAKKQKTVFMRRAGIVSQTMGGGAVSMVDLANKMDRSQVLTHDQSVMLTEV